MLAVYHVYVGVTLALLGFSVGLPASLPSTSLNFFLHALAEPVASELLLCQPLFYLTLSFL